MPVDNIITAAIVTYKSAALIPACLESLPAAFGSLPYRVVVADNESGDDIAQIVRRLTPSATVVEVGRNGGYAAGINAALATRASIGPALILKPDLWLKPGAVPHLLAELDRESCGIAVPRIVDPDGVLQYSLRRDPSILRAIGEAVLGGGRAGRFEPLGEMVVDPERYERKATVAWASGAVMLISVKCQEVIGAWDEAFFLYSEETDYAIRARQAGLTVNYVPEACAVHIGGEGNTSSELRTVLTRNRIGLYRKYHGAPATAVFSGAVFVNEGIRALAGGVENKAAFRGLLSSRPWRSRREPATHPVDTP
jgi:N-acetylglucosaminyl-diphospho-decaprenol L-rhamnosyltransferase